MAVERRYQVFVSSTYQDLEEERREIIQALLELDCIPSGMELFPAANDDQWTLIKRVIDDCDYYIVVIAGRYGSVSSEGVSYTEMEYRYALATNKPIMAFLHKNPSQIVAAKCESEPEKREKLTSFRDFVSKKMVKFWETPADLGSVVSRSLIRLIKDNPSHGWVKGDNLSSDAAREEILKLKNVVDDLNGKLKTISVIDPDVQRNLSRGNDEVVMRGVVSISESGGTWNTDRYWHETKTTWNELFAQISPLLIDEGSKAEISKRITNYLGETDQESMRALAQKKGKRFAAYEIDDSAVEMCIVQFIAINYVERGVKRRTVHDRSTYWKLTSLGEKAMYELRAIRREERLSPLVSSSNDELII